MFAFILWNHSNWHKTLQWKYDDSLTKKQKNGTWKEQLILISQLNVDNHKFYLADSMIRIPFGNWYWFQFPGVERVQKIIIDLHNYVAKPRFIRCIIFDYFFRIIVNLWVWLGANMTFFPFVWRIKSKIHLHLIIHFVISLWEEMDLISACSE